MLKRKLQHPAAYTVLQGPTMSIGTGPEKAASGSYYIHVDASRDPTSPQANDIFQFSTYELGHSGIVR